MRAFLDTLGAAAERAALPLLGVADVDAYDAGARVDGRLGARHPWARTVVVLGQGGAPYWERFCAVRDGEGWLRGRRDPLDTWTRIVIAELVGAAQAVVPVPCRIVLPTDAAVDFRRLGLLAGLGVPSRLGLLMHPRFGTWIALRAALVLPVEVSPPPPAVPPGFAPCDGCVERPCEAACPVDAIGPGGWDVPRCVAHRARPDETCAGGCHARLACPVGAEHRYPPDALRFHQAAARRVMRSTPH